MTENVRFDTINLTTGDTYFPLKCHASDWNPGRKLFLDDMLKKLKNYNRECPGVAVFTDGIGARDDDNAMQSHHSSTSGFPGTEVLY